MYTLHILKLNYFSGPPSHHKGAQFITVQYSRVHYSVVSYNIVQYSTVIYKKYQYS